MKVACNLQILIGSCIEYAFIGARQETEEKQEVTYGAQDKCNDQVLPGH